MSASEALAGLAAQIRRRVPPEARRALDIGSGAGEVFAALRGERPGLSVSRAGAPGSLPAADVLPALEVLRSRQERFDLLVLAGVLGRVHDPFEVLERAAGLALPGAAVIVAEANVAAAAVVEGLVEGRFAPVAGPPQPLRWFTRGSLREALEESGFVDVAVSGVPERPAEPPFAAALREAEIGCLPDELSAELWIATARAASR